LNGLCRFGNAGAALQFEQIKAMAQLEPLSPFGVPPSGGQRGASAHWPSPFAKTGQQTGFNPLVVGGAQVAPQTNAR